MPEPITQIRHHCQTSPIGKLLPAAFYLHHSALHALDPIIQAYEHQTRSLLPPDTPFTLIKFSLEKTDHVAHPVLKTSMQIDLRDLHVSYRDYDPNENPNDNPPILHWKDAYVLPDYPQRDKFAKLTQQETHWGLLDRPEPETS